MALSQTLQHEQILGQGYTHKKFNCGYSHKKLGLRFRQREPVNNENISQPQAKLMKITKQHTKDIFRPYALDETNTPRKRKVTSSPDDELLKENAKVAAKTENTSLQITKEESLLHQPFCKPLHIVAETSYPATATCFDYYYSPALSPNSYNMSLQRQRAALYMRYMAHVKSENFAASLQSAIHYSLGYPNVIAPIFNGC